MGDPEQTPTLYEWAGGREALARLIDAFYDRVERDELISPLFHVAYVEWGTRLALQNSQPGAQPPEEAPVPRWGWGVAPPYRP